ncbi:MAG: hypothetical protein IJT30_01795 [Muribaculaceae bacterium]|nr:hypothetical protein [Muribaculaceae bacterium]
MTDQTAANTSCLFTVLATALVAITGYWPVIMGTPFVVFVVTALVTSRFVKDPKPPGESHRQSEDMHYDPQSGEWAEGSSDSTPNLSGRGDLAEEAPSIAVEPTSNAFQIYGQHISSAIDNDDDLDYNDPPEEDDLDLNLNIESDYDELDVDDEILDEEEYEEELERYLSGTHRNKRRLRRLRHYLMDN